MVPYSSSELDFSINAKIALLIIHLNTAIFSTKFHDRLIDIEINVTDDSSNFEVEDCFALNCNLSSLYVFPNKRDTQ